MSLVFGHWLWALGYDPTLPSLDRQPSTSPSQIEQTSISTASSSSAAAAATIEPPEPIPVIPPRSSKRPLSYCSDNSTPSNVEPSPQIAQPPSPVSSLTDTLCEIMEPLTLVPVQGVPHSPQEKPTASHVEVAVIAPASPPAIEATGTTRRFSLSPPSRTSSPADAKLGTVNSTTALATPSAQEGTTEQETSSTSTATSEAVSVTTTMATTIASSPEALETTTASMATASDQEPKTSQPDPDLASQLPTPPVPSSSDSAAGNPLDAVKTAQPPRTFTMRQVALHNSPRDLWMVIGDEVFDCTEFALKHPGGSKILNSVAGKDATKKFDKYHRRVMLENYRPRLQVGFLEHDPAGSSGNARKGFLGRLGFGGKGKPKEPYDLARRGTM